MLYTDSYSGWYPLLPADIVGDSLQWQSSDVDAASGAGYTTDAFVGSLLPD